MRRDLPIEYVYTTTHSADDAYKNVLAYAGASLSRDALDEMIVNDAKNNVAASGTGSGLDKGFINTPDDITYPEGTELDGVLPVLKSLKLPPIAMATVFLTHGKKPTVLIPMMLPMALRSRQADIQILKFISTLL